MPRHLDRHVRGRVYVTPQYWALWLYSNFAGDTPVATRTAVREYDVHGGVRRIPDIRGVPYLAVLATTDSRRHDLTLFVVNRDAERANPAVIWLQSFDAAPNAAVRTLTAGSILEANNETAPRRVEPRESHLTVSGGSFQYVFPKASLTVITIETE